jgi:hypothetical protein
MLFDALGEALLHIWKIDTDIRTTSALGESESSQKARKVIAVVFLALLLGCAVAGFCLDA